MKYLLKQNKEDKGILCDKVTIDGFDYYVSEEVKIEADNLWVVSKRTNYLGKTFYPKNDGTVTDDVIKNLLLSIKYDGHYETTVGSGGDCDLVIATNNPNIDIPKVVDEVDIRQLAIDGFTEEYSIEKPDGVIGKTFRFGFVKGYNKSQETHSFSEENMTEFGKFCGEYGSQLTKDSNIWLNHFTGEEKTIQELLQLWKEQQPKIVYYE